MWDYTEVMMDHFRQPRNVGSLENPDGVGKVGSLACGDALMLMFKVDGEERITEVKFQTFGCASAIASSSALTEMIKGKTLDEALAITNQDIAEFLGGLPEQKMHCSVMGRDALQAAVDNYRKGDSAEKQRDSDVVCNCFGVTAMDIERAINENALTTVEEVTNYTKAGGGCGNCHEDIQAIINRLTRHDHDHGEAPKADEAPRRPRKMTTIQKIRLIEETLEREIRPSLRQDGGDIELVDVDVDLVVVSLRGTCSRCKVSQFTLKDVVEAKLREFVSISLRVVEENQLEEAQ